MVEFEQELDEKFPDRDKNETFLTLCSDSAMKNNLTKTINTHKYGENGRAKYGVAQYPQAVQSFFEATVSPTPPQTIRLCRKELDRVLPSHASSPIVMYFADVLETNERALARLSQVQDRRERDLAKKFLQKGATALRGLRTDLKRFLDGTEGGSCRPSKRPRLKEDDDDPDDGHDEGFPYGSAGRSSGFNRGAHTPTTTGPKRIASGTKSGSSSSSGTGESESDMTSFDDDDDDSSNSDDTADWSLDDDDGDDTDGNDDDHSTYIPHSKASRLSFSGSSLSSEGSPNHHVDVDVSELGSPPTTEPCPCSNVEGEWVRPSQFSHLTHSQSQQDKKPVPSLDHLLSCSQNSDHLINGLIERIEIMRKLEASVYKTVDYFSPEFQMKITAKASLEQEVTFCPSLRTFQHEDTEHMNELWRRTMCLWMYEMVDHFDIPRNLVMVSMNLLDRFFAQRQFNKELFKLAGATALLISTKSFGFKALKADALVQLSQGRFHSKHIWEMELLILR